MTEKEAPERIWAFLPDIFDNMSVWQDQPAPTEDAIEYTRADIADAKVAVAYEAAGEACDNVAKSYDVLKSDRETYEPPRVQKAAKSMVRIASEDIRALTPADAQAALDAYAARIRREERERAAGIARGMAGHNVGVIGEDVHSTAEAIAAAIERGDNE